MTESQHPISRHDLERSHDAAVRLATAQAVQEADERATKKIVAAVEAVLPNVTLQIGMSERLTASKIDGLRSSVRWQILAGLLGGQVMAGTVAAVITKTSPAEAGHLALDVLAHLL